MKKIIFKFILIATIFWAFKNNAQVSNYSFTQSFSNYGPSTGTMVGTNLQDDDVNQVNLPFSFTFNGTAFNTVNVCSNGYLSFDAITGTEYSALSDLTTTNVIAPFAQDLFMGTAKMGDLTAGSSTITNVTSTTGISVGDSLLNFSGDFTVNPVIVAIQGNNIVVNTTALNNVTSYTMLIVNGSLIQSVTGISPARICEFEFKNMTRFGIYNEVINFKVRLHEGSNAIEVIYGDMLVDAINVPAEVGLKGAGISDFNSRNVFAPATWSTSIAAASITDGCDFSGSNFPSTGLTFVWTPTTCVAPTITLGQLTPSICAGMTTTITANGATSFTWSTGALTGQIVETPSLTTTYTVIASNGACSSTSTITQYVNPLPVIGVSQSHTSLCSGKTGTLTATGASSYSWSNGSTVASIVITPTTTTTYTLKGDDGNCNASKTITQQVSPSPSLSIVQTKTLICRGQSSTLTVNGAGTYTWNNGSISNNIIVQPNTTTVYSVTGATGECVTTKTVSQSVASCAGVDEKNSEGIRFSVYPNPFTSTLNFRADNGSQMFITLTNSLGSVVYSGLLSEGTAESIDTEQLPPGIYVVSLSDRNSTLTKKIIKN